MISNTLDNKKKYIVPYNNLASHPISLLRKYKTTTKHIPMIKF